LGTMRRFHGRGTNLTQRPDTQVIIDKPHLIGARQHVFASPFWFTAAPSDKLDGREIPSHTARKLLGSILLTICRRHFISRQILSASRSSTRQRVPMGTFALGFHWCLFLRNESREKGPGPAKTRAARHARYRRLTS